MKVILRKRFTKSGGSSFYLENNIHGKRIYEFLRIYQVSEKTTRDKEFNKQQQKLAEAIRTKRELAILEGTYDVNVVRNDKIDFFQLAEHLISSFTVSTKGHIAVIKKLKKFCKKEILLVSEINENLLSNFYDYLDNSLSGESPSWYIKKLKRIFKEAYTRKIIFKDLSLKIKCRKFYTIEKDVLTPTEIKKLINTYIKNIEVRDSFLFSCMSGLRWIDLKMLRGNNIDGNILQITQSKTKKNVTIVLNAYAQKILQGRGQANALIFQLPSYTMSLRYLKKWVQSADIQKRIGYHNARHSFANHLMSSGADIHVISKLLGHANLRNTVRYVQENNLLKEQAVNNLLNLYNK